MKKIQTIFERNWEGNKKVIDQFVPGISSEILSMDKTIIATEKLDGTNVRITVRNGFPVRVEKRRNPDKYQKAIGIVEPWYVDASQYESQDKWIFDGITNTDIKSLPDGEWSGELLGPDVQGNPLNLDNNRIVFFSLGQAPVFEDAPATYAELKEWLPKQKSRYGNDCGIEGIVWNLPDGRMFKIKLKDF